MRGRGRCRSRFNSALPLVGETSDMALPARSAAAGDRNMRRIVLLFGFALTFWLQGDIASADWHTVKAKWDCFWDRVHLDWHRNNAWPEPFTHVDRQATRMPIDLMVDKGWQLQNTIPTELFDEETQELTQAGRLKVQWILTQMPARRRMVFVLRGTTAEMTEIRLKSVEKAALEFVGETAPNMIALTDVIPRGGSGSYYERVSAGYEATTPPPRLPEMEDPAGESN